MECMDDVDPLDAEDLLTEADDVRGIVVCAQAQLQALADQLSCDLPACEDLARAVAALEKARQYLDRVAA